MMSMDPDRKDKNQSNGSINTTHKKNIDVYLEKAFKGELLPPFVIQWLCACAINVLREESNVVSLAAPTKIVGDIHGQFYDLLEIFKKGGYPPSVQYLFLGDYVDRGAYSVQVITLLTCLKVRYPESIFLLRGNHECRQISSVYGFLAECQSRYKGIDVWKQFTDMFDHLPIAALIDEKILAIHGGLSPSVVSIDQIRAMDRFDELPYKGPLSDIVWSDPSSSREGFWKSDRGSGYLFGRDVVEKFVESNKLKIIVRSHQLCQDGYQVLFDGKMITVWSAPNYCYRMGNKAAILAIEKGCKYDFMMFNASKENEKKCVETTRKLNGEAGSNI